MIELKIKKRVIELMKVSYYGKTSRTRWKGLVLEGSAVLEEVYQKHGKNKAQNQKW